VPVAAKVAVAPATGLPAASLSVIVTVEVVDPSAVTPVLGEAAIVEVEEDGVPAMKVTVLVTLVKPAGPEILIVFVSATVVLIVPVATPDAFVTDAGWTSVFPVPVEAKVTLVPVTALLLASRSVTVTVEVVVPSAVIPLEGEPEIVEFATVGAPATKVTVVSTPLKPAGVAILTVFASAIVDFKVAVATPEALVAEPG